MLIPVAYRFYNFGITLGALFSGNINMLLGNFSSATTGVNIIDDTGVLYLGEEVPVGGRTMTMIGSGTVTPGMDIGFGINVPFGTSKDVIIFEDNATGKYVFAYPDGQPNLLGAIALVVNLDPIGYNANTLSPVCFGIGTRIATPDGPRAVEDLVIGDLVLTERGEAAPIRWIATRTHVEPSDKCWPIEFKPGSMGNGFPLETLYLSPQHRICLPPFQKGGKLRLVPALMFVGLPGVRQVEAPAEVSYVHLLLDHHEVVWAEGIGCEMLLMSKQMLRMIRDERKAQLSEVLGVGEEDLLSLPSSQPVGRILKRKEALQVLQRRQKAGWPICTQGDAKDFARGKAKGGPVKSRPEVQKISRAAAR